MNTFILKLAPWGVLSAIAYVTLSPISDRPRVPLPVDAERIAAFYVLGLLFALAYPRKIWVTAGILLATSFGLELLQELRPDRHGRLTDATFKTLGAGLGWLTAIAIHNILSKRHK